VHPINTAKALYKGTKEAADAYKKEYLELRSTGISRSDADKAATLSALEAWPLTAGLVERAEKGGTKAGSPEAVGAAAEAVTAVAAPELAGKVIPKLAKSEYVSKTLPKQMITNLIKPMAGDVKFGKNPALAVLNEKLVANSLQDLGDKTYARMQEVGQQIDKEAASPANATKKVDVSDAMKPLDEAIEKAVEAGDDPLLQALRTAKTRLTYNFKEVPLKSGKTRLMPSTPRDLKAMSPTEALAFKRRIGDMIQWNGVDQFEQPLNAALGGSWGVVKDNLNQAVPAIKGLNERYSNLTGAMKAIERRIPVAERNAQWSLSDIALGATGHPYIAIARKFGAMPAVKTRVAQALYRP
jgi:hypothetical protein